MTFRDQDSRSRLEVQVRGETETSSNAFVSVAEGLRFKSRTSQIGQSIANGSPPLLYFFKRDGVVWAQCHGDRLRKLATRFDIIQRV